MSAAALAAFVPALASAQVSLATVVDLAQRNSNAVRIAQADIDKAHAQLAESKDVIIPSLTFSTGLPAFPEHGFTGQPPSLWSTTIQSLVFGPPQKHFVDAATAGLQAASVRLKDEREQVALEASTAYIELDAVNRELDAARQQSDCAARLVDIEQQRAEAGIDPLSDLLQAKLTTANLKLARLHLETRAAILAKQLSELTGLPVGSITPDKASIPELPKINGEVSRGSLYGLQAAQLLARSKAAIARGNEQLNVLPQLAFYAQYNRNTSVLNNVNHYFANPLPTNNFSSGFNVQVPVFDMAHRAKARESEADALRARVEAEQAERQNDVQIAELTGALRELDALAEVAALKQQIAVEQLKTVQIQRETGNGAGTGPGTPPQLSPKVEQLALIDERQKFEDSLEANFALSKARLGLLRSLGHMQDWLSEIQAH